MKNKIAIIIVAIMFSSTLMFGQELMDRFNYYQQELFINPAFAGSQNIFSSTLGFQRQWADIDGSPSTQRLQAHAPFFKNQVGLGLSLQRESFGVSNNFNFSTHYAYRIQLTRGTLSFGLQLGIATAQTNYSELSTPHLDPALSIGSKVLTGFSSGIGAYYTDNSYYIGLSAPYLIDNSIEGNKMVNKLDFEKIPFYLTTGYVFTLNSDFKLKPTVLLSYSGQQKFGYNVGATVLYNKQVWLGALARYDHQIGANLGFNIMSYFNINYACIFNYGELYAKRGVTHEIVLNIALNLNGSKPDFKFF